MAGPSKSRVGNLTGQRVLPSLSESRRMLDKARREEQKRPVDKRRTSSRS